LVHLIRKTCLFWHFPPFNKYLGILGIFWVFDVALVDQVLQFGLYFRWYCIPGNTVFLRGCALPPQGRTQFAGEIPNAN